MRSGTISPGVSLIEGPRRDTGGQQTQEQPGEIVDHIDLSDVPAVGQDHVGAEHRHGQAAEVKCLTQQDFPGPLAVPVAVGVGVVDRARRADGADIAILGKLIGRDLHGDRHRRHEGDRFDTRGDGQLDHLGSTNNIRPEQLLVGQHVIDQRADVRDQVHTFGQSPPGCVV